MVVWKNTITYTNNTLPKAKSSPFFKKSFISVTKELVPSCKTPGVLPALEIPHIFLESKAVPELAEYFLSTTL